MGKVQSTIETSIQMLSKKVIKAHAKDPKIRAPKPKSPSFQAAHSLWDNNKPSVKDKVANSDNDESSNGSTQTET
jgi:hypothetical protein